MCTSGKGRRWAAVLIVSALVLTGCDTFWAARVNIRADGTPSTQGATAQALTADGQVALISSNDQLAPGGTFGTLYRRHLATGTTDWPFAGIFTPPGYFPEGPVLDADGSVMLVAFNLESLRIYGHIDFTTGTVKGGWVEDIRGTDLSDDGRYAALHVAGGRASIFDAVTDQRTTYDLPGSGNTWTKGYFTLSSDGSTVSYEGTGALRSFNRTTSAATTHHAVPTGAALQRGVVADHLTTVIGCDSATLQLYVNGFGETDEPELASVGPDGNPLAHHSFSCPDFEISDDGRVLAFVTGSGARTVYVRDLDRGVTRQVAATGSQVGLGGLSADGRLLHFSTSAQGVIPGDTDTRADPFVVATFAPFIEELSQYVFAPGESATVTITGAGFHPDSTATITGPGVNNGATTYVSPNELYLDITVDSDAAAGVRNVDVTVPGPGIDSQGRTATTHRCGWCVTIG